MRAIRLALPWAAPPDLPAPVPAGGPLLEAAGVTVALGDRTVVEAVDLVARAGEVVALVGPNGAGKSSLLSAVAGDLAPVDGDVRIAGRPVDAWAPVELALRRAVLPQHHAVGFPFTVAEVVRMGRAPWRGTPGEDGDAAAVAAALAAVDIGHVADRPVLRLSGGEQARVALARVLAQATQLLFLDEPTAALDLHHQEGVLRAVRARTAAGAGAVVVLHDLGQAAAHADRIVVLDAGREVAAGTPREVLRADLLSDVYRHPIEVLPHPETGALLVLPQR